MSWFQEPYEEPETTDESTLGADEPSFEATPSKYERTRPPFPSHGPDGDSGIGWNEYFKEHRGKRPAETRSEGAESDEDAEDESEYRVDIPTRQIGAQDVLPGSMNTWMKFLENHGYTIRAGYRRETVFGKIVKSGAREGEMNPDRQIDHFWLYAGHKWEDIDGNHRQRVVRIAWDWPVGGKAVCQYRYIRGEFRLYADKELKELIDAESVRD